MRNWLFLAVFVVIIAASTVFFLSLYSYRFFEWPTRGYCSIRLTRAELDQSLELGTKFLINHQKADGRFTYEYDWINEIFTQSDSPVRQAGAMWGLALIYQDQPSLEIKAALEKAMGFFSRHSQVTADGQRYIIYPGNTFGRLGTVALCTLAYIEYLRVPSSFNIGMESRQRYLQHLGEYLQFLINAQTQEGLWPRYYDAGGLPFGESSPYYDGESLLALVKAAKYMGYQKLQPFVVKAADAGYTHYVQKALRIDPDSRITKGYYQWGSMAFFELATAGWPNMEKYGDYVISLADWMIDIHKTLWRKRNTAYAYEGIIHAYQLSVLGGHDQYMKKFACVIDTGLMKLTSWQVGSPMANWFIRRHPTQNPYAIGGIQNHAFESLLRIDVTQHQMHAVILARRYVYNQ